MLIPSSRPGSHCLLSCNLWIHVVRVVQWEESVSCLRIGHILSLVWDLQRLIESIPGFFRVSSQAFLQYEAELSIPYPSTQGKSGHTCRFF